MADGCPYEFRPTAEHCPCEACCWCGAVRKERPSTTDAERITRAMAHLGPRALKVLRVTAERLAEGASAYAHQPGGGDFSPTRNYRKEGLMELIDFTIYERIDEED